MVQVPTADHISFGIMTLTYFLSIMEWISQVSTFKEYLSKKGQILVSC